MVSAAILLLPLAGCLAAIVMRLQKIRLAYVWLALVSGVLLSWVIILLISPDTPIIFTLRNFLSLYGPELEFSIGVSNANWPILIFVSSTLATYLMTDITSLDGDKSLKNWLFTAIISLAGMLTILSANYWMIIIGWTLLDLIELVLIISYRNQSLKYFKNHFLLKLLGSVVFIYIASMLQTTEGGAFFSDIDRRFLVPLIASAILHSGVFTYKKLLVDQEISIVPFPIRILPFISSLSSVFFLGYVPFSVENRVITIPFTIFIFVTVAIIAVIDFSTRESNLEKYLTLYIFTGLLLLSFLAGLLRMNSVIIVLLLFPNFWELLSTHSSKSIKLVRILFYLLISGLSMALPVNNFGKDFGLIEILGIIAIVILLSYEYARYFFKGQKIHADLDSLEPWFQFFYIGGFTVLVISAARLIVKIIQQFEGVLQFWWVPASLITLVTFFYFLLSRSDEKVKSLKEKPKLKIFDEIRTSRVFPNIFAALFSALSGLFGFITGLFEGGGGILWAVTILALFLTLLSIRGGF